jgi:transcription-repair coupling factor (superfamily II helicase)
MGERFATDGRRAVFHRYSHRPVTAPLSSLTDVFPRERVPVAGSRVVVPPALRAFVLAGMARHLDRPLLVVVPGEREAADLVDDIDLFTTDVLPLPAWEILPFEHVSPNIVTMARRVRARHHLRSGRPGIVVASVRAAIQRVTPPPPAPMTLAVGDEIDLDALLASLVTAGYVRTDRVESRGEVAVRGGIVDVYPADAAGPVRLELWGDEIDSMRTFAVGSQRATGDVASIVVHPAREMQLDSAVRATADRLRLTEPWAVSTWDRFAEGIAFPGMESWLPWFAEERTVVDEAEGALAVVFDPLQCEARAAELRAEEDDLAAALAPTWGSGAPEAGDHPALYLKWRHGPEAVEAPPQAAGPGEDGFEIRGLDAVPGDPGSVATAVTRWRTRDVAVLIAMDGEAAARRVARVLAEHGVALDVVEDAKGDRPVVLATGIHRGFVAPEFGIGVVGEQQIAGRRRAHRTARRRVGAADPGYEDLEPGDYVVHHHHGIGRFEGLVHRDIAGVERDYLLVAYHGDDRLYVPTDQLAAVRKYTGGETPRLSRMGGGDWASTRARVRKEVAVVAQEVVDLYRTRAAATATPLEPDSPWQQEFESAFPFEETPDQLTAIADVKTDLEAETPMDRLIFGDVGFGKTEVAIRAAFKAIQSGRQVAMLVPTTLLAQQHGSTITERLAPYPMRVETLSRFLTQKQQGEVLAGLATGDVDMVIGTHRLLSGDVVFADLGLLIIDEEQRFGVAAKDKLRQLRSSVHVLTLTATPIPRTLEMALTGIREVSHIRTPPEDRHPILTYVGPFDEQAVSAAIRREMLREGQVFYVHNRIQSIDRAVARLRELVPDVRYAVAHGRLSEGQLEQVMYDFWNQEYDVLVATTIIESGLDLPQVNTLIVERADRLGLAQLYQLRGRVGRSNQRAYAYLLHPPEETLSEEAYRRLEAIGEFSDLGSGFQLAMRDLEIRGAGSILSQTQAGHIAAVGFDLYTELVADAVSELKGEEVDHDEPPEVRIDLPVDAHLPGDYVPEGAQRLEAYRKLAVSTTNEAIDDVVAEWRDRFGPLPEEAAALIAVARLRVEAIRLGLDEVVKVRNEVRLAPVDLESQSQEVRLRRLQPRAVLRARQLFIPAPRRDAIEGLCTFLRTMWPPEEESSRP